MNVRAVIVIALCGLASACREKDTGTGGRWRAEEPRLRADEWNRPAAPPPAADCAEITITMPAQALRVVREQPECLDEAITALERFAAVDPVSMSDLAAAYFIRAKREDRVADFLHAYDAVEHAVASRPDLPAARFNRARIEEELGLRASRDARDANTQWAANRARLPGALQSGDGAAVARLIAPFPKAADSYFEWAVKDWAKAPTPQKLDALKLLATEMTRLTNDGFALDVVGGIGKWPDGNAFTLVTRREAAITLSQQNTPSAVAQAARSLVAIQREARARGYERLAANVGVTHAYCLIYLGRFMDALGEYDELIAEYERLHDPDGVIDTRMRRISSFRGLGEAEVAWREALAVVRDSWRMSGGGSRVAMFGEVAQAALAAGSPSAALRYADAGVEFSPRTDNKRVESSAYRTRAQMESRLGRLTSAQADLDRAIHLADLEDADGRRIIQARIDAVQGELLLKRNPLRAIERFTAAFEATSAELPTIQASLLAQRAEARFDVGQKKEAEADLVLALNLLRGEESRALETRRHIADEDYWSSYFSRFQGAFRRLISDLVDSDRKEDAFEYAERARAFEPLNFLMRPKEIDAIALHDIQEALPAGTFILEYCVLEDRTLVWIISHDDLKVRSLRAGQADVARWSDVLHRAARQHKISEFEAALNAPFVELLEKPLAMIGPGAKRLVIIPDGPMYALPFPALHDPNSGKYLLQNYVVATAGSAKLYLISLRRDRALASVKGATALLIGDPLINDQLPLTRGLLPLPHARAEVDQIKPWYDDAVVLTGADATIPRFFQLAPGSAVIHIAAHGLANAAQPSHSLIVLAPSEGDPGTLDAQRLLEKLRLDHTRLVVLSACSSAGGLPIGPEGVAPLVRPLIAAGVPAVIGSLWDVNDATAEALLVSFHRHYRQGLDAAAALQAAQLDKLGSKKPGDQPAWVWAPFEVIGYSSSPPSAARRP